MQVEVDETTLRFLDLLVEHDRSEPPEPDGDRHLLEEIRLVAKRKYEWEREGDALRLMVSARLLHAALDQYADAV